MGWRTAVAAADHRRPGADRRLGQQSDPGHGDPLGGIAAVFASVLPYAIILRGVRRGRLSDKNISLREQRIKFGVVAITSILIGLAMLAAFDAPAEMVALLASIAVGVACGWVITLWWKISVHAAIAAGAATVLMLVFGTALLAAWPLVALIAWSRVQVGDHTPAVVADRRDGRRHAPGRCRAQGRHRLRPRKRNYRPLFLTRPKAGR